MLYTIAVVLLILWALGLVTSFRIDFEVDVPAAATPAGPRLLLPVVPYRTTWRDSFRHTRRTSSVYFPYLARESDDIVIALPEGMRSNPSPAPPVANARSPAMLYPRR